MKKILLLGAFLVGAVVASHAQESRMDASVSLFGLVAPDVYGNGVDPMTTTKTGGFLGSFRYLLTPRSGLELNYGFAQNSIRYNAFAAGVPQGEVHTRMQELSAAYVYSRNYKRFNPFVEAGIGGILFTPIRDNGTHQLDAKQNTQIGGLFGAGLAYEISPSFDIRVQYRGMVLKAPDFGETFFKSNRYYVLSTPALGVAYHF